MLRNCFGRMEQKTLDRHSRVAHVQFTTTSEDVFVERLNKALGLYRETITIIDELLEAQQSPQVVILLACARLDSLANLACKGEKRQDSFCKLLAIYSGEKDFFAKVSVGDLYRFFWACVEMAETMIEKPGRFRKSLLREEKMLADFLIKTDVPITGKDARRLATKAKTALSRHFHVKSAPYMSARHTRAMATTEHVRRAIVSRFKAWESETIGKAVESILREYRADTMLYRNYRCQVIHGFDVEVDSERFFSELKPFHYHGLTMSGEPFLQLMFPGPFLRNMLDNCLNNYTRHLAKKRKAPWDLHRAMFRLYDQFDTRQYLDAESI
jgi:hypothetical protein